MKKLIFLVLVAIAGWYGWNHRDILLSKHGSHDAVIVNHSGRGMERIRLTVDGQTLVKEALADEQSASLPFRVSNDSDFELDWQWAGRDLELHWRGGMVPKGPMVQRHTFTVDGDGSVTYEAQTKLGS